MRAAVLLHDLPTGTAERTPQARALKGGERMLDYATLTDEITRIAHRFSDFGVGPGERVAVWLEKRVEAVIAIFAASMCGAIAVPMHPGLKARQVAHILSDCEPSVLVTARARLAALGLGEEEAPAGSRLLVIEGEAWHAPLSTPAAELPRPVETVPAMIFYTSGSSGPPKGVVVSHRNLVAGACSVAEYLANTAEDRILAVLPLGFDYGFSQLTTAFLVGAEVVLKDFLMPHDLLATVARERITGLAGVPALWARLARCDWPDDACGLRYITNSGGRMPRAVLERLRSLLPETRIHLMYGLTEAFRSTQLPPEELDRRPESIGRAIPNVEIAVVDDDGRPVPPGVPGELVHRGPLVALGYWRDPVRTAERFRPWPLDREGAAGQRDIAVFSGDRVVADRQGFLTFLGRADAMIKSGGFRISPEEVEEPAYEVAGVSAAAAFGAPDEELGERVVLLVEAQGSIAAEALEKDLAAHLARELPAYMVPREIVIMNQALPRTPNGKIDRRSARAAWLRCAEEDTARGML